MASASTTSLLLAPPRFSCQIAGRPTPAPTNPPGRLPVPSPTIRPRRRFAAARCEASLVPSWQLRAPSRRRNTLREKAAPPPLVEQHQVRPPSHEPPDSRYRLNQDRPLVGGTGEPQSASSDGPALLPDLDDKLENFDSLDAGRIDAIGRSNLGDVEKDLDWDAEESRFRGGIGTGPLFSVYQDPDGNAVRVDVNEDEIVSRCAAADGEGSSDLQSILSRARVMAMEFESGQREVPKNSSLVRFVAIEKKGSQVVDAEVSVMQTHGPSLRAVAWSGFAAFFGVCIVFVVSKSIWRNMKAHLFGMRAGQFNKGNGKIISNVHMFPGDLLGRPQLERSELMNNLKKAKESRQRFSFRNVFSYSTGAKDDDASIAEIRGTVGDVNTLEEGSLGQRNAGKNSSVVLPHSIVAIEEEVSTSQSVYLDDVLELDSIALHDISLSDDIIDESVEQSMDLKHVAPIIDTIVTNQYSVGEIKQPDPIYNDESTADAKDRTSVLYATEREAHIHSVDDHSAGPNGIDTLSAEFERKGQFPEKAVSIQELKPSVPFTSDGQMVYKNDNAHQISNDIVPETVDDFSPNCFNIASSELKYNGSYLANAENDINFMQVVKAPTAFANDAKIANCEGFAHCVSIKSKESCENLIITDVSSMKSPQRIREDHVDLMPDNMQEPEPSNRDGKEIIYANTKDHKIDILHDETKTSWEACSIETLDKASRSPLYSLQEEAVEHKDAEVPIPEKQEKITSSNIEARAYLKKDKGKLQKEMCSDKVTEIKLLAEGAPGTSIVVDPSDVAQKTKRVAHKRLKKVQSNQGVAEQDIVHNSSMVDHESSSQNIKRTRRKNETNAFRTQGSQTREEIPETTLTASLPDDAPAENTKPVGEAGSSAGTLSSKDIFRESQPSRFIAHTVRKEELKLDFQTSERVEATAPETKTNMDGYNAMHERSTDVKKSKTKMCVAAAKKPTKRKSLAKRTKSSTPVSNKDSEEPTGD